MATDWVEVTITSEADSGELLGALNDPAVTGAWQERGFIHLYWPSERWTGDRLDQLRKVLEHFGPHAEVAVDRLPDRDWNAEWARQVKPLRIGRRVVIRPSWERIILENDDLELIIDPKQAFGTGHHATTRLMIELLEELIHGNERVLDVGTGSGVLAMVALRLGASTALGIDHDQVAIDCAREYAALNRFGSELRLATMALHDMTDRSGESFDLILANLDRGTLCESSSALVRYLDGGARLVLSGLLTEQQDEVTDMFAASGACVCRQRERDGWVAVQLVIPESCE